MAIPRASAQVLAIRVTRSSGFDAVSSDNRRVEGVMASVSTVSTNENCTPKRDHTLVNWR